MSTPPGFNEAWRAGADDPLDHGVVALDGGVVVGTISLEVVDGMGQGPDPPARGSEGLLGYLVDPAHHGRGYATELVRAALDLAFGDLGLAGHRRVLRGQHRVLAGQGDGRDVAGAARHP
jgi:RimJ/RimL family protein N-acetyltransferase